jgi:hypothetical protein
MQRLAGARSAFSLLAVQSGSLPGDADVIILEISLFGPRVAGYAIREGPNAGPVEHLVADLPVFPLQIGDFGNPPDLLPSEMLPRLFGEFSGTGIRIVPLQPFEDALLLRLFKGERRPEMVAAYDLPPGSGREQLRGIGHVAGTAGCGIGFRFSPFGIECSPFRLFMIAIMIAMPSFPGVLFLMVVAGGMKSQASSNHQDNEDHTPHHRFPADAHGLPPPDGISSV